MALERKLSTGYRTIKANCEILERFGQVHIKEQIHPANGRSSHLVSITSQGFDTIKKKK
ncbi:hypothetical protein J4210_01860 [Candidatus Woesearchaeota archaeon]|nr:hypothetical protein [Candidatus Woesearchaeota archaeon]